MITVLADGTFDGLHFGHIAHLQQARRLGDRLVVALATDGAVQQRKGPDRPRFSYNDRAETLRELSCVDEVIPCIDSYETVSALRPEIYAKGLEYRGVDGHLQLKRVTDLVESYGGRVAFVGEPLASSTQLLHEMETPGLGPLIGAAANLDLRRDDVEAWLDQAKQVNPHLLGEHIIDRYIYVTPAQKSPKEEVITYIEGKTEQAGGGIHAIGKHMVESTTAPTIEGMADPIIKTRYVSEPFLRKVFSVARPNEIPEYPWTLIPEVPWPFLVVGDFGHGYIPADKVTPIVDKAGFLALTVQSNSLNWGFNLLTKWHRADYFVVDEQELRLARANRRMAVRDLLRLEHHRLGAKVSAVTLGHNGCLVHDGTEFFELPALTSRVVDRMGAGDAFFAWTAGLAYVGAPLKVIALVGNIAGAIQVGTVGNKEPVTMAQVKRWVKGILL